MAIAQTNLQTALDMPAFWPVLMGAMVVVGLLLWLVGGKLSRFMVAVSGMILAAGIAWIFAAGLNSGWMQLILVVGSGMAGCLLSLLLFRAWMGVTCALLLALAAPLASLAWSGDMPAVKMPEQVEQLQIDIQIARDAQTREEKLGAVRQSVENLREQLKVELETWWEGLGDSAQTMVIIAAGLGALVGFILGLLAPETAASFQTCLVGSALMLLGARALLNHYAQAPPDWLASSNRHFIIALGLITILGIFVQWTIQRRKAD